MIRIIWLSSKFRILILLSLHTELFFLYLQSIRHVLHIPVPVFTFFSLLVLILKVHHIIIPAGPFSSTWRKDIRSENDPISLLSYDRIWPVPGEADHDKIQNRQH
jgi:hypothetical protein